MGREEGGEAAVNGRILARIGATRKTDATASFTSYPMSLYYVPTVLARAFCSSPLTNPR